MREESFALILISVFNKNLLQGKYYLMFCKKQFQMKSCYLLSIWNIFHIVNAKNISKK